MRSQSRTKKSEDPPWASPKFLESIVPSLQDVSSEDMLPDILDDSNGNDLHGDVYDDTLVAEEMRIVDQETDHEKVPLFPTLCTSPFQLKNKQSPPPQQVRLTHICGPPVC